MIDSFRFGDSSELCELVLRLSLIMNIATRRCDNFETDNRKVFEKSRAGGSPRISGCLLGEHNIEKIFKILNKIEIFKNI